MPRLLRPRLLAAGTHLAIPLALLGLTAPQTATAQAAAPPSGLVPLASLRDVARPLLIFAAAPDDPQLQIQLRILAAHAPDAAERNLVAIALPYHAPSPTAVTLSSLEADSLRRHLHVSPGAFTVILLGKDGGEKLRSVKPLSIERLNQTIDAMPMRQQEMHPRP